MRATSRPRARGAARTARAAGPRRPPLGATHRAVRRPAPGRTRFPYEHLGDRPPEAARRGVLAGHRRALPVNDEPLADSAGDAGLRPPVRGSGRSAATVGYGADGPVELVPFDPIDVADAVERLLDDEELWRRRSEAGRRVRGRPHLGPRGRTARGRTARSALAPPGRGGDGGARAGWLPAPRDGSLPACCPASRLERSFGAGATPGARRRHRSLLSRLAPEDVAAVEAALEGEHARRWQLADATARRLLALAFGVWYRVPAVLEKTGLSPDEPPEDVHAMARGAAGRRRRLLLGGHGRRRAASVPAGRSTTSGARSTSAAPRAAPARRWRRHGRRSNGTGSTRTSARSRWAREHLRGATFAVSGTEPAARLPGRRFDLVYAISIWSHFNEGAAVVWLRRDAPHRAAGRSSRDHGARRSSRSRTTRSSASARPSSSSRSAARYTVAASGSLPSSAKRATTASSTRSGAPRS